MWIEGAIPVDDPTELEWLLPRFTGTEVAVSNVPADADVTIIVSLHKPT